MSAQNQRTGERKHLDLWDASKPDNFFAADTNLIRVLKGYRDDLGEFLPQLQKLGKDCVDVVDPAAILNDRREHHPRLDRFGPTGERTENVDFHPSYHTAGQVAYGSGVLALQEKPGNRSIQFAMIYLLAQCGEMGHTCPIACTSGLIKALQLLGTEELKDTFLPGLLSPDYSARLHGAQFVTEIQGGSDVGTNTCTARKVEDGTWRIRGEKWFCSNVTADLALLTARPDGAPDGTAGLGLFLVPRHRDDGTINELHIQRLKDKLGTRTMPTAEVEFRDAFAWEIGPLDQGFKNMVGIVLDTSRVINAACSCGFMRRAWVEASTFARHRSAFGNAILQYPLVQETLSRIKVELYSAVASTVHLNHLLDRIESGTASDTEKGFYRLAVNMNKYVTSLQASNGVHHAMELLGGNGSMEAFSILPRLYRDAFICEAWEGAHNVLVAQVWRDATQRELGEHLWGHLEELLSSSGNDSDRRKVKIREHLNSNRERFELLATGDPIHAALHMRRWADHFMAIFQATCLLNELHIETQEAMPTDKGKALSFFMKTRLTPAFDPCTDSSWAVLIRELASGPA